MRWARDVERTERKGEIWSISRLSRTMGKSQSKATGPVARVRYAILA